MRRFLFNSQPKTSHSFDVIIVGGGLSGLYTALLLDPKLSVALVVKTPIEKCNSSLAQGGIAAAVDKEDDAQLHLEDTLLAAAGIAHEESARLMVVKGPAEIARLASMGVDFDTDDQGNWHTTMEGAHTRERILHCGGDATGRLVMEKLSALVRGRKNIHLLENHFLSDILTSDHNRACGIVTNSDGFNTLLAPHVVICTGGIGSIYQHTTNRKGTTGDGIAAAMRAGAQMQDMEFVQFHPTAYYKPGNAESFSLISEAVRGEGAVLRNSSGEAFMQFRHPMKDLAPRDVVAREIFFEMQKEGSDHVFLDITSRSAKFLSQRFPTIYTSCSLDGLKMERDMIPVLPVQHYFMGGIKTNVHAQTSIPGLFACGEAACTGVHGANRLASNSLLECLVFASQAAGFINSHPISEPHSLPSAQFFEANTSVEDAEEMKNHLKALMQKHGGIARNETGLKTALAEVQEICQALGRSKFENPSQMEVFNMAMISAEILVSALKRKESLGSHFREDYSFKIHPLQS